MTKNKTEKKRRDYGDGALYFREGDNRWVGSFYLPDGTRKYVYGSVGGKKEEARQKLKKAMQQAEQGTLVASSSLKVADYIEYWLNVKKLEVKQSTFIQYSFRVHGRIIPALGKFQIQKLSTAQVQTWINKMIHEGLKPGAIHFVYTVLNMALKQAVEWGYLGINPCKGVKLPRGEDSKKVYLTPDQAQILLDAVKGHKLEAIITLALSTGLRRGELLGLKWSDINFQDGTLQVQRTLVFLNKIGYREGEPKTKKSQRTLILPQFAQDALKEHRKRQLKDRLKATRWEEKDLVFANQCGDYTGFVALRQNFGRLLKRAGLPPMRFHDLRHSAATLLLSMKVPQKVVQEILGHTTSRMTEKYLHVLPSMQQEAMTAMDLLLANRGKQSVL